MPTDVVTFASASAVAGSLHIIEASEQASQSNKDKKRFNWEFKFALLRAFKKYHGHCRVPSRYVVGGVNLGGWVDTQRKEYAKHRVGMSSLIINEKRIARLERVGFDWSKSLARKGDGINSNLLAA